MMMVRLTTRLPFKEYGYMMLKEEQNQVLISWPKKESVTENLLSI